MTRVISCFAFMTNQCAVTFLLIEESNRENELFLSTRNWVLCRQKEFVFSLVLFNHVNTVCDIKVKEYC